jgi:general secretion pathway protein C
VVPRDELNRWLTNLPEVATQARIVPDSLYAKLGIQNGDVIRRINGYEMNSPDRALEVYQKVRDAVRIEIDLERRGEGLRNSYSIE